MADDRKLHVIEPIVTADKFEYGLHRMAVPGGWIYWLQPAGGAVVTAFVPLPAEPPVLVADELNALQGQLVTKIADNSAEVTDGAS